MITHDPASRSDPEPTGQPAGQFNLWQWLNGKKMILGFLLIPVLAALYAALPKQMTVADTFINSWIALCLRGLVIATDGAVELPLPPNPGLWIFPFLLVTGGLLHKLIKYVPKGKTDV